MNIHDILWRNQGQTLTPELITGILFGVNYAPAQVAPVSLYEKIPTDNRTDTYGDYVFAVEPLSVCLEEVKAQHLDQWNEIERIRQGTFSPDYERILHAENNGTRIQFTIRKDGNLVGNCACYLSRSLHTGRVKAQEDTMYVAPDYRKGRLALKFFRFCEQKLLELGVKEISVTTKEGTSVHRLWEHLGYEFSDRVLSKVFED